MANYFEKLFPRTGADVFNGSFKLIFVSEGYTAAEENLFFANVIDLWDNLMKYYPLSMISANANKLSLYAFFTPSQNHGYSPTYPVTTGRTAFESYYNASNLSLQINNSLADNFLDQSFVKEGVNDNSISEGLFKFEIKSSPANTLVIILLPSSNVSTAEAEIIDTNYYYKIITTFDNFCEQLIIRAIGKLTGLGDEYDLPGANYLIPSFALAEQVHAFYPNLIHIQNNNAPNPSVDLDFKWRYYFPNSYNQTVPIHTNSNPNVENRNLPLVPLTYDNIELWEGGLGYRTKIFRSATDCLMRRKIGDATLPLKSKKIGLCPICKNHLEQMFAY